MLKYKTNKPYEKMSDFEKYFSNSHMELHTVRFYYLMNVVSFIPLAQDFWGEPRWMNSAARKSRVTSQSISPGDVFESRTNRIKLHYVGSSRAGFSDILMSDYCFNAINYLKLEMTNSIMPELEKPGSSDLDDSTKTMLYEIYQSCHVNLIDAKRVASFFWTTEDVGKKIAECFYPRMVFPDKSFVFHQRGFNPIQAVAFWKDLQEGYKFNVQPSNQESTYGMIGYEGSGGNFSGLPNELRSIIMSFMDGTDQYLFKNMNPELSEDDKFAINKEAESFQFYAVLIFELRKMNIFCSCFDYVTGMLWSEKPKSKESAILKRVFDGEFNEEILLSCRSNPGSLMRIFLDKLPEEIETAYYLSFAMAIVIAIISGKFMKFIGICSIVRADCFHRWNLLNDEDAYQRWNFELVRKRTIELSEVDYFQADGLQFD